MESEERPFISVIIPTFNRVDLLKETVESVRNQTFRDFELIVVNDGSSDGTAQWLSGQTDLRVFTQENSGIAASRNKGASAARGPWLAFLDHDDLWAPDKLEIQAAFVKNHHDIALVAVRHERLGREISRTNQSRVDTGRSPRERILGELHPHFIRDDTSGRLQRNRRFSDLLSFCGRVSRLVADRGKASYCVFQPPSRVHPVLRGQYQP